MEGRKGAKEGRKSGKKRHIVNRATGKLEEKMLDSKKFTRERRRNVKGRKNVRKGMEEREKSNNGEKREAKKNTGARNEIK